MSETVTPGQAAYEAFCRLFPVESWGPWEGLAYPDKDDRPDWEKIAQAAIDAKPGSERVAELVTEGNELREQLTGVYRERAHLVAHLAAIYPSCIGPAPDADGWAIVYIAAPEQMTWHIAYSDLDLFGHVHVGLDEWDGHTTAEKYARLDKLTARRAGPAAVTAGTGHLAEKIRGLAIGDEEG